MPTITVKVILDTRRPKRNGAFPLRLRISLYRKRKYYHTGIELTTEEWIQTNSIHAKPHYRQIRNSIAAIEDRAIKVIEKIKPFSFQEFENQFFKIDIETENKIKNEKYRGLKEYFNQYITLLKNQERYGSANLYNLTLKSLLRFKKKIDFKDITPEFLNQYETWGLEKGLSLTTIGIYLRHLRCIINPDFAVGYFLSKRLNLAYVFNL